jgi:hypothetical protein
MELNEGWTKDETIESLVEKAGFDGELSKELLDTMQVERYQSSKAYLSYPQYKACGKTSQ